MKLVVDANILIATLIKEGFTRELILNEKLSLYVPETIITEFLEHIKEIELKAKVSSKLLKERAKEILRMANIKTIDEENLKNEMFKACEISPDPDDAIYFALAIKLNCPIWSNDKKLKQQDIIKIYSTHELFRLLESTI